MAKTRKDPEDYWTDESNRQSWLQKEHTEFAALKRQERQEREKAAEKRQERDGLYAEWLDKRPTLPAPEKPPQPQIPLLSPVVVRNLAGDVIRVEQPASRVKVDEKPEKVCTRGHIVAGPNLASISVKPACKACANGRRLAGTGGTEYAITKFAAMEYAKIMGVKQHANAKPPRTMCNRKHLLTAWNISGRQCKACAKATCEVRFNGGDVDKVAQAIYEQLRDNAAE